VELNIFAIDEKTLRSVTVIRSVAVNQRLRFEFRVISHFIWPMPFHIIRSKPSTRSRGLRKRDGMITSFGPRARRYGKWLAGQQSLVDANNSRILDIHPKILQWESSQ